MTMGSISLADSTELAEVQQWIVEQHPGVNHIDSVDLVRQLGSEEFVVFDVREKDEFSVSHLENAVQVDPDVSRSEFFTLYGENLENKTVVFYCSVGRRSSLLAEKLEADLQSHGTRDIFNLRYGIFGWHNQDMPLVSNTGTTRYVHPYNQRWGRMLDRKQLIRYTSE